MSLALSSGVCAVTKSQNTRRQEVLDAYLNKHGDDALLPDWGRDYRLHQGNARKARTPRAMALPPKCHLKQAPAAAVARAHGGINLAAAPPFNSRAPLWHALGIKAS